MISSLSYEYDSTFRCILFLLGHSEKSRLKPPEMSYIPRLSNDLQKSLKYFLRACKAILIASPTTLKFHPRLSCNLNDVYCFRYFLPSETTRPCCTTSYALYLLAALDRRESYSRRWLATIFHRPLTRHSSFYFLSFGKNFWLSLCRPAKPK